MGSNMAEAHPIAFGHVVKAKELGAKVIHIDPHYSRTSALANGESIQYRVAATPSGAVPWTSTDPCGAASGSTQRPSRDAHASSNVPSVDPSSTMRNSSGLTVCARTLRMASSIYGAPLYSGMMATMEWVSWYNEERIHSYCGDMAPKKFEELYYKALESSKLTTSSQT